MSIVDVFFDMEESCRDGRLGQPRSTSTPAPTKEYRFNGIAHSAIEQSICVALRLERCDSEIQKQMG
jgi:hypothetical protein